jgi:hypothetical protein
MSLLGFDKLILQLEKVENKFLKDGMALAQSEFRSNFDQERDSETGTDWADVVRGVPPPILNVTGNLKSQTLDIKNVVFRKGSATLTVDPIDYRGKGYANYHMTGTRNMVARPFLTQSQVLIKRQKELLEALCDNFFNQRGTWT